MSPYCTVVVSPSLTVRAQNSERARVSGSISNGAWTHSNDDVRPSPSLSSLAGRGGVNSRHVVIRVMESVVHSALDRAGAQQRRPGRGHEADDEDANAEFGITPAGPRSLGEEQPPRQDRVVDRDEREPTSRRRGRDRQRVDEVSLRVDQPRRRRCDPAR